MFSSCDGLDTIYGYGILFLAFLLSTFNISVYNKLPGDKKKGEEFQFALSIITLVLSVVYFLYKISGPVSAFIRKR